MVKEAADCEELVKAGLATEPAARPVPAPAAKARSTAGLSPATPAGKVAALLAGALGPARGAPGGLAGKAQLLKDIQKTFGNAYAQRVIASYRAYPGPSRPVSAALSAAPPEPAAAPPPGKLAALLARAEAGEPGAVPAKADAGEALSAAGRARAPAPAGAAGGKEARAAGLRKEESPKGPAAKALAATKAETSAAAKVGPAASPKPEARPALPGETPSDSPGGVARAVGAATAPGGGLAQAGAGASGATRGAKSKADQEAEQKAPPTRLAAGDGPFAGAGGGGRVGAGVTSPRSPKQDSAFQEVEGRVKQAADGVAAHGSAASKAGEARSAAVGPANEVSSKAAVTHAGVMQEQVPKPFRRDAFKAALVAKIAALTPKSLEEADKFKESGKVGEVKGAVGSQVAAGKAESQGDIANKTKETPDASGVAPKPVTPLQPETAGPAPGGVGALAAAPKPKAVAETSLEENRKKVGDEWKQTGLDDADVERSNEPSFKKGLSERTKAQNDCAERPHAYREKEADVVQQAQAQAEGVASAKLDAMRSTKVAAMANVAHEQGQAKTKEEQARERVAGAIKAIFDRTKAAVERRLARLDADVNAEFDRGAEAARAAFETHVEQRMRAYKFKRYFGPLGPGLWVKDKLLGMPAEVNAFYAEGRDLYLAKMDAIIDGVAATVEAGLNEAKEEIARGKAEVDAYAGGLEPGLQGIAREEAAKFAGEFDALEQSIQDKQGQLVDALSEKYVANLQKLDDRVAAMKAANQGLVDAAIGAIKDVAETIAKLKHMLLDTLARARAAIGQIIKDPIGFLRNLVAAVKGGILGFKERIGTHLQQGLMAWLLGALGSAGITLPPEFDFKGVLSLVMQVLGLTYANIRARAVAIVGERVVKALEATAEVFKILLTQGPAGLWAYLKDQLGDLKSVIIDGIKSFVIEKLIVAGVSWLISLLNPASAFVKACKLIYDIVLFFVQRAAQIMAFVNAVIDSMSAIASGNIAAASAAVEGALARAIPVVLGFLAALLGLGGISDKIRSIIEKVRAPVNKAIDWVINKAVALVKAAGKFFAGQGKTAPDERTEAQKLADLDRAAQAANAALAEEGRRRPLVRRLKQIKERYRLTRAQIVVDEARRGQTVFHADLEINPRKKSKQASEMDCIDPPIAVEPKFFCKKSLDEGEFTRQIRIQETTINAMDVHTWLGNRDRFEREGRSAAGTKKQRQILEAAYEKFRLGVLANRIKTYRAAPFTMNRAVAEAAAEQFVNRLLAYTTTPSGRRKFKNSQMTDGQHDGRTIENRLYEKAALHAVDQVAGGGGEEIVGLGGAREDYSLGAQWKGQRVRKLEEKVRDAVKGKKADEQKLVRMNVKLIPFDKER